MIEREVGDTSEMKIDLLWSQDKYDPFVNMVKTNMTFL